MEASSRCRRRRAVTRSEAATAAPAARTAPWISGTSGIPVALTRSREEGGIADNYAGYSTTFGGVALDVFPVKPQTAGRGPRRAAPSATLSSLEARLDRGEES